MPRSHYFIAAVVLSILGLMSACGNSSGNNSNSSSADANPATKINANSARTDVEELGVRVNLPFETEEAVWKEVAAEKKLIAVIRFTPENSAKIVADAEKARPATRVDVTSETWFPPELIAQADMTGDDRLAGNSYAAISFVAPPYTDGSLIRIDNTDYFILQVSFK
ncbi:MAG TPA: hypothetical protein PKA82_16805 [Pyrinomonadaceae bacterium]|nr:hypothetical protein [Pyrinomonadaceae bacterium]